MRVSRIMLFAALGLAAIAAAGCTSTLRGRQLAEYCSDARNAGKDLCAVNSEIQSTRAALAVTDRTANEAKAMAMEANGKNVVCTTKTLNRVRSASCDAGYTLMGCTQTRFTRRAGGMAILRSVNDQACSYNAQVLEVQARCCMVGTPTQTAAMTPAPAPEAPRAPSPTS